MNKRGISGILITVLLVLLAIGALGILWIVILSFINQGSESINIGANTLKVEVVESSLKYLPGDNLELIVKRDATVGNISGVKVVIDSESGNSYSVDANVNLDVLESKKIIIPLGGNIDKITKVSVYPLIPSGKKTSVGKLPDDESVGSGFVSSEGLVGYWSFDNDQGNIIKDDSGNGNNGFCDFCPIKVNGIKGIAYEFNGSKLIGINFSLNTKLQVQEFTVTAWVYPKQVPTGDGRVIINEFKYYGDANQKGWIFGNDFGSSDFIYTRTYNVAAGSGATVNNFFSQNLNKWTFVSGTYKPSTFIKTYVNGEKISESTSGVSPSITYDTLSLLRIGARSDNSYQGMWNGTIDEVRIYNRSLSAQEIYYLYKYG